MYVCFTTNGSHYRKQLVQDKLNAIEYGYDMPTINILDAVKYIEKAWKIVSPTTIFNCFQKAGFLIKYTCDLPVDEEEETNLNSLALLIDDLNKKSPTYNFVQQDYLTIDFDLAAHG